MTGTVIVCPYCGEVYDDFHDLQDRGGGLFLALSDWKASCAICGFSWSLSNKRENREMVFDVQAK